MAEPKTRPTDADVAQFLAAVPNEQRRADAIAVAELLREVTGEPPVLWGTSIVGFGSQDYPGSQGKRATWPLISFSPRRAELVLYLNAELEGELFDELGPHRRGVGCLYLKRLTDLDHGALRRLIDRSIELARR